MNTNATTSERQNDEQQRRLATVQSGMPAARAAMSEPAPPRVAHLPFGTGIMGSAASVAAQRRPSMREALGMPEP
jgi:hypothetical protein